MIAEDLLFSFGAQEKHAVKGEFLFHEGDKPVFFYQIKKGSVSMCNFNKDGKEFIQGIFGPGESFGEPPLFDKLIYPASAIANVPSQVLRLEISCFHKLLGEHPDVLYNFTVSFARRLHYKAMILGARSSTAEERILTLINYYKAQHANSVSLGLLQSSSDEPISRIQIPLTRRQMADLTGLRVETVIRVIKVLETKGEVEIIQRKVFR